MKLTIETIRIKLRRYYMKKTSNLRKKKIKNTDFTIFSNNCWGGFVYQSYGLAYNSPTIGLFFMAGDYLKFISEVNKWVYAELEFIKPENSKYSSHFKNWDKFGTYPIGKFAGSDIEIHFQHYNSEDEAYNNWKRRTNRINWNKVLYKFNDQNLCTSDHIRKFSNLPHKNKICFTSKDYSIPNTYHIKCPKRYSEIQTSYEPFGNSRVINVNKLINSIT
ncbi:DUF1919 domain-containing protein [Pullulanibacillus sp. KACC 23026]|uniref:DUF1919 domain-containing protein n=1 Tax=Pullulanibacillus sp. KACC 23026 TaxID=3028315 RepID=UPI0023B19F0A|nr:DUF1919 domain-containing protein [Pullulanibacillus sp. KACC 23026]WEG13388.1 DUF1919 domain-containing protein [Pullulanibacillus sp. KACC 23026]